ncbi:MAG TPA: hypothetical protein VIG99_15865 [Myxococcaceae bacterium]
MALAQPAADPPAAPRPPPGAPAEAPDAGSPAPAPASNPPPPPPKPEAKTEPKPEPKPESKPPEQKPEPAPEAKADAGTSPKPPKPEDAGMPRAGAGAPAHADAGTAPPHAAGPPALNERARAFFAALLAGEPGPMVKQAELPFFLEDKRLSTMEQLKSEWLNQLRSKRTDLLTFKGFEVLTPAEMEQRFGKPPARLSSWPIGSGKTYLVVANLSGRAAVALYHQVGEEWRIVAYHD